MTSTPILAINPIAQLGDAMQKFDLQADQAGLMGLQVAPVVEASAVSGAFGVVPLEQILKDQNTNRNYDSTFNKTGGTYTWMSFACHDSGLEEPVDRRNQAAYASYIDQKAFAALRTRDGVIRNHTRRVYALAQSLSGAQTFAAATTMNNPATASFLAEVDKARVQIRNTTGFVPNSLLIDWELYIALRKNVELRDMGWKTNTQADRHLASTEILAEMLGLDNVFVNGAMRNSGNEMAAASLSALWIKSEALVFVRPKSADPTEPCFARTFHYDGGGSEIGGAFQEYFDPTRDADVIRHRLDTDERVIYQELGVKITGLLS